MKKFVLVITACLVGLLTFAQLKHDSIGKPGKGSSPAERRKNQVPANLPEGTYAKDNKVYIKDGYKGIYDANKKTVAIARINSGGGTNSASISGQFSCYCDEGTGGCDLVLTGRTILCASSTKNMCSTCTLQVVVEKPQVVMMLTANPFNSNMNWKIIEIPKIQQ